MYKRLWTETNRWVEQGIIDETQRGEILALYHREHAYNPVFVFFAVLGSLLLGLGIILIFAVNWQSIPKALKLGIAFIPLLAAMGVCLFTLLTGRKSAAYRESTALGLCLSAAAAVALVGQVYHLPSDMYEYLRLCMFLFLPAVYLLQARFAAALYVVCVIITGAQYDLPIVVAVISAAAVTPFLALQIKRTNSGFPLAYVTVLTGALMAFVVFKCADEWMAVSVRFLTCAVLLLALDAFIKRLKHTDGFTPLTQVAVTVILLSLMLSCFRDIDLYPFWNDTFPAGPLIFIATLAVYAAVRLYKNPHGTKIAGATSEAIALCAALGLPFNWLWSTILLAMLGVWFIITGGRAFSMKRVNGGMLLLIFVTAARFFDSDLGLLERGIAFIVIGAGFFLANLLLYKKWRSHAV